MILSFIFAISFVQSASVRFDYKHSEVSFSGIASGITLPVYYFHLNLFDENGEKLDQSPENRPKVEIVENDGAPIRGKVEILDSQNGKFIVRIKTFTSLPRVKIVVTDELDRHFLNSPATFENLNHDECRCAVEIDTFQKAFQLEARKDDVLLGSEKLSYRENNDLVREYFASRPNSCALCHWPRQPVCKKTGRRTGIKSRQPVFLWTGCRSQLCHYVLKSGRIFRECFGQHVGFNMFSDATLVALSRFVNLPDGEFWMNLGDWPHSKTKNQKNENHLFQMVSWGSHADFSDLVVPTYDLMDSTLGMMHRLTKDQFSVQSSARQVNWSDKIEKGFFRGRDSRQERLDLAEMSQRHPELVDAAITRYFFFKEDEQKYGKKSEHVPFDDHFKFKYQINVDGTVAAYRLPYLLLGNSAVFKQQSAYFEHFYPRLELFRHFIPLKRDLSDLIEKIKWAKENDEKVAEIVKAANQVAEEETAPVKVLWSWISLLKLISENMSGEVLVTDEMEEVPIPTSNRPCSCSSDSPHSEL